MLMDYFLTNEAGFAINYVCIQQAPSLIKPISYSLAAQMNTPNLSIRIQSSSRMEEM